MFGKNPIRPPEKGDGSFLDVQKIFLTLQGEGPRAGQPAIFIRLGGCNLACAFCDTEFESFTKMPLSEIIAEAKQLGIGKATLAVITGGEPFRQPIAKLCEELIANGFLPQIETNGTLYRELPEGVEIVCSPKSKAPIRDDLMQKVTALKFIVSAQNEDYSSVPEVGQAKFGTPVYVQPMDEYNEEANKNNLAHTTQLAIANGFRLSIQTHKVLGIE